MEIKESNKLRHVQVPNNMCKTHELEPFDLLVYANIKRFMNQQTKEAWPSIATLKSLIGSRSDKIRESISRLKGKYFGVYMKGRKAVYVFSKRYKNFEPFSYEFLDKSDLTPAEKAYIIASQQFMFKDIQDLGKMSFSAKDLSQLINMPEWEIWRHDRSLRDKGYLNVIQTKNRNFETGLPLTEKVFDLKTLGQQIIWQLTRNNERIQHNSEQLRKLQKDLQLLKKLIQKQKKAAPKEETPADELLLNLKTPTKN